ncbi:MAG: MgtC/SapB family protein [Gemmatimonadota bacterium]
MKLRKRFVSSFLGGGCMSELMLARNLAAAALAGLAVGIEREWSGHASGPQARFAGVRTFLLLGLLGGLAGWLISEVAVAAGVALLAAAGGLILAAYVIAARRVAGGIDGTTEAAAIVVLALGLVAGVGEIRVASGATAVVVLALGEKGAIHRFVGRIGEVEMRAALQFAVLALVVLPLLPAGPFGPLGVIRPRALWTVVLLFSGLNFAAYLVRRSFGDARGYPLAGALGGLLSSTAVTLTFARLSHREPAQAKPLALGAVAASVVLVPRVVVIITALNADLTGPAILALIPLFLTGVVVVAAWWIRARGRGAPGVTSEPANPLQLGSAIRMAIAFQIVLLGMELITRRFGSSGILAGAAIIGLTDVDALTMSLSRLAEQSDSIRIAARALLVGVIANTLLKAGLALVLGTGAFRRLAVPALASMAVAAVAGWWLLSVGMH